MATELYDLTIPVFLRGFKALSVILEKGRAHADENRIPHEKLLGARLCEDMAPLTSQIQRASDAAKFTAVRLGQIENVPMDDNEASFDALLDRIARTVAFLEAVDPAAINGREDADVELKTPNKSFAFKGRAYALNFALPNFYFHVTTAYAILRSRGVPLGKMDYLGGI
jgi:hypothetical protein